MNKEAGIGSYISGTFNAGKGVYEALSNLMWLAAPTAAALATIGGVKALKPEAVAKNADKLLLNEALKSSLARSIREREIALKSNEYKDAYNDVRRHDRFI